MARCLKACHKVARVAAVVVEAVVASVAEEASVVAEASEDEDNKRTKEVASNSLSPEVRLKQMPFLAPEGAVSWP